MWKKYLPLVVVLALVIAIGVLIAVIQRPAPQQSLEQQQPANLQGGAGGQETLPPVSELPPVGEPALPPTEMPPVSGGEAPGGAPAAPPIEPALPPIMVTYDGKAFSPASTEIKKGDTVIFINQGTSDMWVASALHPTHEVYPTKGGCIGSTFDACQGFPKGASWGFTFTEAGSWKYHDHLNPNARGTIIVK